MNRVKTVLNPRENPILMSFCMRTHVGTKTVNIPGHAAHLYCLPVLIKPIMNVLRQ